MIKLSKINFVSGSFTNICSIFGKIESFVLGDYVLFDLDSSYGWLIKDERTEQQSCGGWFLFVYFSKPCPMSCHILTPKKQSVVLSHSKIGDSSRIRTNLKALVFGFKWLRIEVVLFVRFFSIFLWILLIISFVSAPSAPPEDFKAEAISSSAVRLSWKVS